jgi:outer membrane autotransporter protein
LKLGGLLLTPFAGIQYSKGTIPSFTEAGAGDADLTVLPISADRTDLLFGANITSAKGHFRPYAKVAYRSEMGSGGGTDVSAYFDGDTATSFTVTGLAAARHEVDADAGVNIVFEDEGTIFAGVEGTVRNDLRTEGVHLGLRLQF